MAGGCVPFHGGTKAGVDICFAFGNEAEFKGAGGRNYGVDFG